MAENSIERVLELLNTRFPEEILNVTAPYELLTFECSASRVHEIISFLKTDSETAFGFLTDLCGIHYPEKTGFELGVVYHLHNLTANFRLRIKVFMPVDKPEVPTITDLYLGANWMERETYDFYGIIFTGHPDLRRILNVDDMVAFPMRREFPLEDPNRKDKHDEYFGR